MKIISLGGTENNMLGCLHETENVSGCFTGRVLRVHFGGLRQFVYHDSAAHELGASDQRARSLSALGLSAGLVDRLKSSRAEVSPGLFAYTRGAKQNCGKLGFDFLRAAITFRA